MARMRRDEGADAVSVLSEEPSSVAAEEVLSGMMSDDAASEVPGCGAGDCVPHEANRSVESNTAAVIESLFLFIFFGDTVGLYHSFHVVFCRSVSDSVLLSLYHIRGR